MPQNLQYPQGTGRIVASFDFEEIATGIVSEKYFLFRAQSPIHKLVTQTLFSQEIQNGGTAYNSDETYDIDIDIDFDIDVGLPRTVEGDFFASVAAAVDPGGPNNTHFRITAILKKNDVAILTVNSELKSATSGGPVVSKIFGLSGTVPTTVINAGDTLRVTILVETKASVGSCNGTLWLAHDPGNRVDSKFITTGQDRTDSFVIIPFKGEFD